ncbi:hypothetical protein LTR66_014438 [Elasticomyces elasticus]|nr:hypothetical protein LTR66_014438 [Elasticomyces elasticus]KAK4964656.1 hypothetical protein LTR28_003628 [Elasticomyces elasticus]
MNNNIICAPCGDSALSIASNVIGLLTFAIATTATYLAYITLALDVPDEIGSHILVLEGTREDLIPLLTFCEQAQREDGMAYRLHKDVLKLKLNALFDGAQDLAADLKRLPQLDQNRFFKFQVRRRVLWLRKRRSFVARSEQLAALERDLMLTLLSLLTW